MKFLIIFVFIVFLNSKEKDFYYSFIDSNGKQISQNTKESILNAVSELEKIKSLAFEGKLNEAFKKIEELKRNNKISFLNSDILILYSELVLKNKSKKLLLNTSNELETAINTSLINQESLLEAYLLLIDLKISVNKIDDARYYAQTVIDIFDSNKAKARGKIALSKIYKYQKDYDKASKTLMELLSTTKNKNLASMIGNELFDIYLLQNKKDEAKELMKQILISTPDFYSSDFILANKRVDLLLKLDMPLFAVDILKNLIKTSNKGEILEKSYFKLANIYMKLYDKNNSYLDEAKILYQELVDNYPKSEYFEESEMYLDEIKMRQRILAPSIISQKYEENELMQNKALLQELVNANIEKRYEQTIKMQKFYREIPKEVLNRFAYKNIDELLDESYKGLVKYYLNNKECLSLSKILIEVKYEIFEDLLEDQFFKDSLISCVNEVPSPENYTQLKNILKKYMNLETYLMLENMALNLELFDEGLYFSAKIEKEGNKKMQEREFFIKYQILKLKNDSLKFDKFFASFLKDDSLIKANKDEPMIIDFYYDFYLYLIKEKQNEKAIEILKSLYSSQNDFKVYIYSPFVDTELAKIEKDKGNLQEAIQYLEGSIKNLRRLKAEDEVKIYYDIVILYEALKNIEKKNEYLQKCKEVNIEDNFYKKMCISMSL